MCDVTLIVVDLKHLTGSVVTLDYRLRDAFLASIEQSDISHVDVAVAVKVTNLESKGYVVAIHVDGVVSVPCDRCLDDMSVAVSGDDSVMVAADATDVDITWRVYETIALAIPLTHVHAEGGCNETMIEKLNELLS